MWMMIFLHFEIVQFSNFKAQALVKDLKFENLTIESGEISSSTESVSTKTKCNIYI